MKDACLHTGVTQVVPHHTELQSHFFERGEYESFAFERRNVVLSVRKERYELVAIANDCNSNGSGLAIVQYLMDCILCLFP